MKITKYSATDYLKTKKDIKKYLNASFATGDNKLIAKALGDVAKTKGISKVAESIKLDRSSLFIFIGTIRGTILARFLF